VHASRLPHPLELNRAMLGLPLPRLAIRTRRRCAERPRHGAPEGGKVVRDSTAKGQDLSIITLARAGT